MKFVKHIVSILIFSGICLTSFAAAQSAASGWKWRFKTLDQISAVQSDEKTVFVAEYNGNAYAVDKQSGRKVWELKGGKNYGYGILLKANVLIVSGGSGDGKIQAFAADTRRLLWSENLAPNVEAFIPAVSENSVFKAAGSRSISYRTDKMFFGFSPEGILLYSTEDESSRRPAALQGVGLREGKILWNINLRALGKAPTAVPKK